MPVPASSRGFLSRLAIAVLLLAGAPACAGTSRSLDVQVLSVTDGDSFRARSGEGVVEVRLYGVDSPEYGQPWSRLAARGLRELIRGRTVHLEIRDRDAYGREVAMVEAAGRSVNAEMVRRGLAWVYPRYCRDGEFCAALRRMESSAREARSGLWADSHPEPPWSWRHDARRREGANGSRRRR